jgi:excisionase family DNA binding protein
MIEPLTISEIAAECRVSESTVRNWIRLRLVASIHFGKRVFVERNDLDAFVSSSRREAVRTAGARR